MLALNRRVVDDWSTLAQARLDVMIRCWDQLANTPTEPIGGRYTRLKGEQAWCEFRGQRLPQWQYEVDRRARVKIGVGDEFVVILAVSSGHPKDNE